MKSFRFKLERVLEWRRVQLQAAEEKLALLQQQLEQLTQHEHQVLESYRQNSQKLLLATDLSGAELQALAAFKDRTHRLHQTIRARKSQCEALVADQRQRLLKARKDHHILEKLKEQRLKSWIYLSDREVESTAEESYLAGWLQEQMTDENK